LTYKIALLVFLAALPVLSAAQEAAEPRKIEHRSLQALASAADLVALVQVSGTDYQYTRNFPSGGTAFLRVLIPYKVTRPLEEFLEVYEEGLHDYECYFPDPTVYEEGRRYLVFLQSSPAVRKQYRGLAQGCALEVFVTATNRYALRFPLTGMALDADYAAAAGPVRFADAHAVFDEDQLTPDLRKPWLEAGWIERDGQGYRFAWGIDLKAARELLGADNLTRDRNLK